MDIQKRIGTFFSHFSQSHYPKGKAIVTDTGINNQVFYVESGFVSEYHISQSGELFIVHLYHPGTLFGMPRPGSLPIFSSPIGSCLSILPTACPTVFTIWPGVWA
jgi:hypothetical protein